MEHTRTTATELKFNRLHKELLRLKLWDLADEFSETFYKHGSENYKAGCNFVSNLNNN